MAELHLQRAADRRWKQVQGTREQFRNTACTCGDGIRKTKAHLEWRLEKDIKNNKKSIYCCLSTNRLNKQNVGLVLSKVT